MSISHTTRFKVIQSLFLCCVLKCFEVVPFICKLSSSVRLALAAPFASLLADPTRRPETLGFFFFFERGGIEM
jgi:hypothetical protein